jgi:hypothetical protein
MQIPQNIVDHLKFLNSEVKSISEKSGAKVFLVGGAVRDLMLGKEPKDYDFVTDLHPDLLQVLNFPQVGKSFPVFHTGVGELACTRTERKTGTGYTGFETSYTPSFKEDCLRRDLTVNAMLWHPDMGLVCPIERSAHDLAKFQLHSCSEAFAEDPVRVLRVARFAASGPRWSVTPETYKLMAVAAKELDYVAADRIRGELERAKDLQLFMWTLRQNPEVAMEVAKWLPTEGYYAAAFAGEDTELVEFFCTFPKSLRADALKKLGYGDRYNNACTIFDMITRWKNEGPEGDDLLAISKGVKRGMALNWKAVMPKDLSNLVEDLDIFVKRNVKVGMSGMEINFMIKEAAHRLIPKEDL